MRQIKFRAWDEGNKVMHNNFQFINSGTDGNDWVVFISDKKDCSRTNNSLLFNDPFFAQQLKVMQFTGLHDKNGEEIYEGDIVSLPGGVYPVTFEDGCFYTIIRDNRYRLGGWSDYRVEVIGNVYEQPELTTSPAGE